MKYSRLTPVILSSALIAPSTLLFSQNKKDKMNIVIILVDDMGWGDVGFHGSSIKTPHLDELAKDGIVMNRFYTAPVSSPTRAGLMTGRYPNRFGIRETVIPPWRDFGLDVKEETMADMLGKANYANRAIIGKWHLGHSRKEYYPLERGFTYFYGHLNGAIDYFTHEREGQLDWHKNWESCYDKGYSTNLITREAVNCINEYAKQDAPFFLYVAYNAPHTPLQAEEEDIAIYTDNLDALPKKRQKQVTYAAMVTCMDRGVGAIRKALKDNNIENNTLFLFFSDNGGDGGGSTNAPLRGTKFTEWDGGVRVPAIINYPDKFKGGWQLDQVVGFVDIMPTIRRMLNIKGSPNRPFDGIDISALLTGKKKEIKRDFYLGCGAIVNNDYKFILPGKNSSVKINEAFLNYYPNDPYEKENAISVHKKEADRLQKIVEKYDAIEPPFKVLPYSQGKEGFKAPFEWKIK